MTDPKPSPEDVMTAAALRFACGEGVPAIAENLRRYRAPVHAEIKALTDAGYVIVQRGTIAALKSAILSGEQWTPELQAMIEASET